MVVGMIDEDALLSVSLNSHRELKVGDLMRPVISPISPDTPLSYAAWLMKTQGLPALPIVGMDGKLQGMVTRADVVSALLRGLRPNRIGGMATPFGVYLTTGNHRGGVGDFALITTGVVMAVCLILARVLVLAALYLADTILRPIFGASYGAGFFIPYLTGFGATPLPLVLDILPWVEILLFFTLMKLLPLTGYHGAEHQVVHAIEQGEDLTPEAVSRMPLEHPRCGTNLAALAILVSMALFSNISPTAKIALVFTAALFWRQLGMWLQRIFTVKRPKPHQLRSGLKAGEELLMKFQHQPFRPLPLIGQFWNMGFLQVLSGAWVVLWSANQMANAFGFPRFLF
jgi:CBS domain-containing protein